MKKTEKILVICIISILVFICLFFVPKLSFFNFKKLGANVYYSGYEDKVIYFDLESYTNSLPSSTEEYDYMKVAFALQGLINRNQPLLYYKYKSNGYPFLDTNIDEVWLADLQSSDNMYQGKTVITYTSFDQVIQLAKDLGVINGAVLWDPDVPATSNVASTIAGVENLIPIRKDETNFSCYTDLIVNRGLFTVKKDLTGKFTGSGYLPDDNLNSMSSGTASSGSTKNDAYLWAKKYYLDNKKVNTEVMGYIRDAWIPECSSEACFVDSWVPENLAPGEERQVFVTILNNSTEEWSASNNYRVGAVYEGQNAFTVTDALYGFEQGDNPGEVRLYLDPTNNISVGERYRVSFTIKAPDTEGTYHLNLGFVHDGYNWLNGSIDLTINVGSASTDNRKIEHYGTYPLGIFHAGLNSSDYLIAKKAFFFDLSPDETIAPKDDRTQPVGTDVSTLNQLLLQEKTNNNNNIFTVIGFVPWFMKYTASSDSSSSMGDVAAEWKMIDIISGYNGQLDADAISPAGLTNSSAFMHQTLKTPFIQNNDKEAIKSDKVIKEKYDSDTTYFVLLMGDYDSGAWTSGVLPSRFLLDWGTEDRYPLTWPIDSDLSDRIPQAFNWIYAHQNRNDYFVAGDNGTGYLSPAKSPNLTIWKNHNITKNNQFDIDIEGFLIGGNSNITSEIQNAYAEMTPVMVGYQGNIASRQVGNTPFIPSVNIAPNTSTLAQDIYNQLANTNEKFIIVRTIQTKRADAYNAIDQVYAMAAANGKKFKLVDPYTIAQLYTDRPTKYKGCYTDGTNYQWVNGSIIPSGYSYVSTSDSSSTCIPGKTKLSKPTMATSSYSYTGNAITPTIVGYDAETMNLSGNTSETEGGNYSITVSLKDTTNYEWEDGSQNDIAFIWSIVDERIELNPPTYTGDLKDLNFDNYDENLLSMNVHYDVESEYEYCISVDFDIKDKVHYKWKDDTEMVYVECLISFEPCSQQVFPEMIDNKIYVDANTTVSSFKKVYSNAQIYENDTEITDGSAIINSNQTAKISNSVYKISVNTDKIHFLKIINISADAIIIESDGHYGLVDTLNPSMNSTVSTEEDKSRLKWDKDNGETLKAYLDSIGCQYLDFIVLTHNHTDHIGGLEDIKSKINNKTIVFYKEDKVAGNDKTKDIEEKKYWFNNDYYKKAMSIFNSKNSITCDVSKSNTNPSGDCYLPNIKNNYITEVRKDPNPFPDYETNIDYNYNFNFGNFTINLYNLYNMSYNIENYNSIVALVTHKNGTRTLLTGDIETSRGDIDTGNYNKGQTVTTDFIENPAGDCTECTTLGLENQMADIIGKIDVLKAAHHGYASSNSYYMINKLQPDYMIVNNAYKYPYYTTFAAASLYANKRYGTQTYYTGQSDNAVVMKFNDGPSSYNIVNYSCTSSSCKESSNKLKSTHTLDKANNWYQMNNITNGDYKYVYISNNQIITSRWVRFRINGELKSYHVDEYGIMQTGLTKIVNDYYYLRTMDEATDEKPEGMMYNEGWKKVDGKWYYFRTEADDVLEGNEGAALVGWARIENSKNDIKNWYYFSNKGVMQKGLTTDTNNNIYYLRTSSEKTDEHPEGSMYNGGWKKIDGKWYYFRKSKDNISSGPEGSAIKNQCVTISDVDYCFDNNGVMTDGVDISSLDIRDNTVILNASNTPNTIIDLVKSNNIQVFSGETEKELDSPLITNDILRVNNKNYPIAILGDVQADGIINIRDITKAYKGAMKGNFNTYTDAEKKALDIDGDGLHKMTDVIDIYDLASE